MAGHTHKKNMYRYIFILLESIIDWSINKLHNLTLFSLSVLRGMPQVLNQCTAGKFTFSAYNYVPASSDQMGNWGMSSISPSTAPEIKSGRW